MDCRAVGPLSHVRSSGKYIEYLEILMELCGLQQDSSREDSKQDLPSEYTCGPVGVKSFSQNIRSQGMWLHVPLQRCRYRYR